MSQKKALRELQERIATLLQQASSDTSLAASWLGVRLGEQKLLLPLQQSGEIYAMTAVQPLPYTKPWFLGVAHLRGNIYGVIELGAFIPSTSQAAVAPPIDRARSNLIGINDAFGLNVVFRVDGLEGLRSPDAFTRSETLPNAPAHLGTVFFDGNNTAWQEVHLQALIQDPQFLDIAAVMTPTEHALPH